MSMYGISNEKLQNIADKICDRENQPSIEFMEKFAILVVKEFLNSDSEPVKDMMKNLLGVNYEW